MKRRRLLGKEFGYIIYAISSINKVYLDSNFINPLTIKGNGTVTYSSSNTDVATIDTDTGEVTILYPGTVIITATVEDTDDCIYNTNTATYTLTVAKATGNILENPTPNSPLTYNELSQITLISSGSGTGTMMYKLDNGEWNSFIPYVTNAGTYTVYYKSSETEYYTESNVGSLNIIVQQATCNYIAPTEAQVTYNGTTQNLLIEGSTIPGLIEYSSDNITWSEVIPTGTNVGEYTSYWRLTVNSNYIGVPSTPITTTINKVTPTITDLYAISDLVYNGSSQQLINSGSVNYGTLLYSLDGISYSTTSPSGINAGDYIVYYKVDGDSNVNNIDPQTVTVTIDKYTPIVIPPVGLTITYDGETHELIESGSTDEGTILYSLDGENYSTNIPTASAQDTYEVWYKVEGNSNVYDVEPTYVTAVIGGIVVVNPTIELEQNSYVYDGTAKTPSVTVYDDNNEEIPSEEYIVEYSNNINAGEATITITDVIGGYYTINASTTFTITKAPISPTVSIIGWTYGDTASTPSISGNTGSVTYTYSSDGTNYSSTIPTDAGTYYIKAEIAETNNYQSGEATNTFTISQATCCYIAPTAKTSLVYNGNSQELINAGSSDCCTIQYSSDNSNWSSSIPTQTNAGTYTVYWRIVGNNNYVGTSSTSISCTIDKAPCCYTAPTAKSDLSYTCQAQQLINAGSSTCGTMKYSSNGTDWTTDASSITGTNVDTYTRYWKVDGDNNHYNKSSESLSITISKGTPTITAPTPKAGLVYNNGSAQTLINAGSATICASVEYSLDNSSWSTNLPSATNGGTYSVWYRVSGDSNINAVPSTKMSPDAAIGEKPAGTIIVSGSYTYTGSAIVPSSSNITVKDAQGNIVPSSEYDITCSNNINAGTATIIATDKWGGNYNVDATGSFTIARADLSNPSVSISGWTYDDIANNPSVTANGSTWYDDVVYYYKLSTAGDNTYTVTKPSNAGTYTIKAVISQSTNYNGATVTNTFIISKRPQPKPSTVSGQSVTYGNTAYASASGGGEWGTIEWSNGNSLSGNVGSKTTKARWSGDSNHNASDWSDEVTLSITKTSQSAPTASGNTSTYATSGSISGSASGGGGQGTLYYKIDTNGGTSYGSDTTTPPSRSRSSVGTTSFVAYWGGDSNHNASSNSNQAKLIINRISGWTGVSTDSMTITYSSITGTRTSSGASGTLSASTSNSSVATVSVSSNTITVTRKGYGTATITVTAAQSTNYNQATSTFTVNCNRASISPSVSCSNLTYKGSTTTATVSGNSGSGTVTWTSSNTGVATVNSSTGVVTPVSCGSTRITASIPQTTNYLAGSAYKDITVNNASGSTGVSTGAMTITYSSITGTRSISGNTGSVSVSTSNSSIATASVSGSTITVTRKGYGSATITCTAAASGCYNKATSTFTVNCNKASRSGSVSCNNVNYNSTVTASVSGNTESGSITWGITNGTGKATINSSGVVTGTQAGTVTVTASVAATTNYAAYTATSKQITVNKISGSTGVSTSSMTIYYSSTTGTRTASGNTGTLSASSSNTSVATVSVSGTTITVTRKGYGSATITVTAAASTNYNQATSTFTIYCAKASRTMNLYDRPSGDKITGGGTNYYSFWGKPSAGAFDGTQSYSSSNTSVATINSGNGQITGLKAGTTTITCSITEGTNYYACSASFTLTVYIEEVNLGLPSGKKWAKCNLGTTTESGYGYYYSWGNVTGRTSANNEYSSSGYSSTTGAGITASTIPTNDTYDAARRTLGGSWRIPTKEEFTELINNTTVTRTTINNVGGIKCTNKSNSSAYVFFPVAGAYNYEGGLMVGTRAYYWEANRYDSSYAYEATMYYNEAGNYQNIEDIWDRWYGLPIKPIHS